MKNITLGLCAATVSANARKTGKLSGAPAKRLASFLLACWHATVPFALLGAAGPVDIYSAKDLRALKDRWVAKRTPSAFETLKRYGNHYTMLAYREVTGSSEVHEHEA